MRSTGKQKIGEMYVAWHMKKFYRTSKRTPSTRQPQIIDIQKKIVEMYVTRKGVEEVVERERR